MLSRSSGARAAAVFMLCGLAACGGGGGAGVAPEPGEWETVAELTKVDVSNLPEALRRDMRVPADRSTRTRGCWAMTADRVRIENLRFTLPEPALRGVGCTLPELVLEGGTLRGRMTCTGIPAPPGAGAQTITVSGALDGTYGANSLRATASGEVRFGSSSASVEMRITSRRLGHCPPPRPYVPRVMPPVMPSAPESNGPVAVVPVPAPADGR